MGTTALLSNAGATAEKFSRDWRIRRFGWTESAVGEGFAEGAGKENA